MNRAGARLLDFGRRYSGVPLYKVPTAYLRWLQGVEQVPADLLEAIDAVLRWRDGIPDPTPEPNASTSRPRRRGPRSSNHSAIAAETTLIAAPATTARGM